MARPLFAGILPIALGVFALGATPIRLQYSAHEGCPDANDWWQAVGRRSPRLVRATVGGPAEPVVVDVRRVGSSSVGSVKIGDAAARTVTATTCGEVIDALALVTVLALDPDANTANPTPSASTSSASTSSPSAVTSPPPATSTAPILLRPVPAASATSQASVGPPPSSTARWSFSATFGVGALALGAGFVPTTPLGVELERAPSSTAGGPSARLSFSTAQSGLVSDPSGAAARFRWTTARLEACPFPMGDGRLMLRTCGAVDGGALRANPSFVREARVETRPWWVVGATARLLVRFLSASSLELEGALGAPLIREDFVVAPDVLLYRPPALVGGVRLGLTVHFS